MKKLLIFDGNSIVNRAFYGIRLLSTKEGVFTNAVYGFLNILFKYLENDKPDYLVVAFDLKKPTFRHKMFDGYKAGRKGMPDELAMQMPILKDVLSAMNISMISLEGYEADDLIGTVSAICEKEGVRCNIATGDRDSLQLASDITNIYLTTTKSGSTETEVMTPEKILEKYEVTPAGMIELKGLMGDSSDNIPGVAGVGEKTATRLIKEYGNIDSIYGNIEKITGSLKTKLEKDKDMAFLSRTLGRINREVPIKNNIEDFTLKPYNNEELAELFKKLEFKNLISKLGLTAVPDEKTPVLPKVETVIVDSREMAVKITAEILEFDEISYYIFTDELGICALSVRTNKKYYYFSFGIGLLANFDIFDVSDIFENNSLKKYSHNYKDDFLILKSSNIELKNVVFDTAVASYIVEPTKSTYDLGVLLGFETDDEMFGKGKKKVSPAMEPIEKVAGYGYKLTEGIMMLKKELEKTIKERNQEELFYNIEMPLCMVLADMEYLGFKIDKASLKDFGEKLSDVINILENQIYEMAGIQFNINSPKQMGEVLFEKLGLPVIRKTKTGYSTDSDVLEKLADKHEIIGQIKEFRTLTKLKSTYCDGLMNVINKSDGKIHSKFNQTVTATGRISSTEPNLQNIPVRMELGRELRKMFTACDENYVLLDADYSQIELRILAHISGDEVLIDAFKNNKDIHTITASQVFGVNEEDVTSFMRSNAKAVNFGIVYGISDFALAGDLKITKKMAKEYIDSYLERYPKVKSYMHDVVENAKETGYVETIMNRRRYIPELKSQKYVERSFGERIALNTPIQGSAADIIKVAMVNVYNALNEKKLKSHLILQVHDELIVETHRDEIDIVTEILRVNMEHAATLSVPLIADVHQGDSWYDAKG